MYLQLLGCAVQTTYLRVKCFFKLVFNFTLLTLLWNNSFMALAPLGTQSVECQLVCRSVF